MHYISLIGVVFLSILVREVYPVFYPYWALLKTVTPRLPAPVKDKELAKPLRDNLNLIIFRAEFFCVPGMDNSEEEILRYLIRSSCT